MKIRLAVLVFVLGTLVSASCFSQSIGPDGRVLPSYSGRNTTTPPPVVTPPPPTLLAPTPAPAAAAPIPAPATIITPAVAPAPVTKIISVVPDGTEVDLKLAETISSARAMEGQRIRFTVAKDVAIDGYVVIQTGALAIGTITRASPKKWAGRSGKLEMSLQNVTAIDGTKIDLSGNRDGSGDIHVGRMVTGMVITSIFTFGGSALFLLMHGKDLVIPEGSAATTFTIRYSQGCIFANSWLLRSIRNSLIAKSPAERPDSLVVNYAQRRPDRRATRELEESCGADQEADAGVGSCHLPRVVRDFPGRKTCPAQQPRCSKL